MVIHQKLETSTIYSVRYRWGKHSDLKWFYIFLHITYNAIIFIIVIDADVIPL